MKHIFSNSRAPRVSAVVIRLVAALLILLMIGSVLTACGSRAPTQLTLNPQNITIKKEHNVPGEDRDKMLESINAYEKKAGELKAEIAALSDLEDAALVTKDNVLALLKGASEGYDMTAPVTSETTPVPDKSTEYA